MSVFAADGQVLVDHGVQVVQVVSVIVGVFLPILVALVTTRVTSSATQAWLLAALSAISGFGTAFLNNPNSSFDWFSAVLTSIVTFITAVAVHFGLWKPTGVSVRLQSVGNKGIK